MNTTAVQTSCPINLTDPAYRELQQLLQEKSISGEYGLRIGVKGGGCSGLSYILGFDLKKEHDVEYQVQELKIFINQAHGMYLAGLEIDYHNDLNNRGFIFNNPNATETCGCGSSFSA